MRFFLDENVHLSFVQLGMGKGGGVRLSRSNSRP